MKFSCFQSDLINGINIVQKAVSTRTNLEILKGILITTEQNKIKLTGNDLNLAIEVLIEAQIEIEGSIVLDSRLFGDIIRKLPDATIDFNMNNNFVEINCLHSNFKLIPFKAEDYPKLPVIENSQTLKIDQNIFKNMIKQTIFAVSQDETRPILTGSLFEILDNKATLVSIDGYRLALKTISIENVKNSKTVIPGKTLNELMKILSNSKENELRIDITDKYIAFEIDNIKIISKILEGEFIKYNQIIPNDFKTKVIVNTTDFYQSIERASLMARESKSATIKLSLESQYIEISSNSEIGSVKDKVNINIEGDKFEIGFNPRYLTEALRVIESEEVILELSSSLSPCILKPIDDNEYIYLVLPVRMSN
ncbi:MAG: DNA polymerase III subunit beta [Clostridiales bacterium]|nr:DNA polymerase III subunit beta [Clostridiales bacterium]